MTDLLLATHEGTPLTHALTIIVFALLVLVMLWMARRHG
jgi:hypothetical protein